MEPQQEIPTESSSQSSVKSFLQRNNALLILGGIILLFIVGICAYYLGKKNAAKTEYITKDLKETPIPTAGATISWKTYTNAKYQYSLQYPDTWTIESNAVGANFSPKKNEVVNGSPTQIYTSSITEVGPAWKNVKDYFDQMYNATSGSQGPKGYVNKVSNFTIDGRKAIKQEEGTVPGAQTESYASINVYILADDNTVLKMSIIAMNKSEEQKNLPTFEQMLSAFQFAQ